MVSYKILQTLSATFTFNFMSILGPASAILTVVLLYSSLWYLIVLYFIWIVWDNNITKHGGRSNKWVRTWKVWQHTIDYFPLEFVTPADWELDSKKNYLFCCHPHGVMPWSLPTLVLNPEKLPKLSNHRFYYLTLEVNFFVPFYRDLLLALGFCDVSTKSINYILSETFEGNVGILFPGGTAESYNAKPGVYRLVLRNRKGFIKLALQNGTDIVPIISFGEIDIFKTARFYKGSWPRRVQDWCKSTLGFIPIIYYGRNYLPVPRRLPIHIVAGIPLQVKKDENPSQETIDALHNEYMVQLTNLFEEYKYRYLNNPSRKILIID